MTTVKQVRAAIERCMRRRRAVGMGLRLLDVSIAESDAYEARFVGPHPNVVGDLVSVMIVARVTDVRREFERMLDAREAYDPWEDEALR